MLRRALSRLASQLNRRVSGWPSGRNAYVRGPDGETVLYGLIGANVVVFCSWNLMDGAFMTRHFTTSLSNLEAGRVHTIITHAFSHMNILHMGGNLIGLYFFGRALTQVMLGNQFLNLYLTGAVTSAAADLAWKWFSMKPRGGRWSLENYDFARRWRMCDAASLGASGSVNAVVSLFCCLFPREIIYVNFLIPVPAFLLGILFVLYDFTSLHSMDGISHAGHLGGVAAGLIYFLRIRHRF